MVWLVPLIVITVGVSVVGLAINAISGWNLDAACAGTASFCTGAAWTIVVEYLPVWLYVGQILVLVSMASPFALVRIGR